MKHVNFCSRALSVSRLQTNIANMATAWNILDKSKMTYTIKYQADGASSFSINASITWKIHVAPITKNNLKKSSHLIKGKKIKRKYFKKMLGLLFWCFSEHGKLFLLNVYFFVYFSKLSTRQHVCILYSRLLLLFRWASIRSKPPCGIINLEHLTWSAQIKYEISKKKNPNRQIKVVGLRGIGEEATFLSIKWVNCVILFGLSTRLVPFPVLHKMGKRRQNMNWCTQKDERS